MALSQNGRSSRRRTNDAGQSQPTRKPRDASGHLPSAPRERRPLLAALAVLLIVGGALLAGLLAMRLDQRVQMLAAKDTIKAGQVINKEDLVSASVSSDLSTLVRADQIDQVVGRAARVEISKGQLLDTSQLATNPVPGGDLQVVGVSVNAGRFPAGGFEAGDMVDVVDIGSQEVIVSGAQVLAAKPSSGTDGDWTSGAVVSVIVDKKNAAKLASSSANGTIAVVLTATGQPIKES
ncbi:SAF domain-containing protein [Actinomyces sp. ZJ308]|uniref:SAF domain-containing protein n=1 Tax=Actinomyces sp. ZJ308 TaxID=2708342 RepID=UPI00141EB80A|nr:SAF domain-containing protein [Actinomyces sp. ZJ308]